MQLNDRLMSPRDADLSLDKGGEFKGREAVSN